MNSKQPLDKAASPHRSGLRHKAQASIQNVPEEKSLSVDCALKEIHRAEEALRVLNAANLALQAGDDLALMRLNFSPERIRLLRSGGEGGVENFHRRYVGGIKQYLRVWHQRLQEALKGDADVV
jgi:hypothetical protein